MQMCNHKAGMQSQKVLQTMYRKLLNLNEFLGKLNSKNNKTNVFLVKSSVSLSASLFFSKHNFL